MNKKNMDDLFREKLKDFRETPDERVWDFIEHSLDKKKKKRRVIPLWWKLAGAAAVLLIALLAINPFSNPELPDQPITDSDQTTVPAVKDETEDIMKPDGEEGDLPESSVAETGIEQPADEGYQDRNNISEDRSESPMKKALDDTKNEKSRLAGTEGEITPMQKQEGDQLVKEQGNEAISVEDNAVAVTQEKTDKAAAQVEITQDVESDAAVAAAKKQQDVPEESAVAENLMQEEEKPDTSGKKSIFDEIDKEDEIIAEESGSKWSVGPTIAPVYFNTFGEGSSIHSNFVSNSKSGNVNLSYGVAVSYEISDKLSLRSGLHKVDYGYDTNDITFSSSLVASTSTQITNINYTTTSRNLVVESNTTPVNPSEFVANDIVAQNPSRSGRMVQEFGYLEVPMELNYSLLDSKFNIDLIGGVSSLFLVNNNVILESGGTSTEMGEANNINDVNFSTNVGLGINYELNNNMKVHLEPMFKYQLNTFSNTEGNFQPYSLGVYTGMSFKF